ncbi:MAG TPA: hypothetical protein VHG70_06630 [Nocardioidaceae bacterium]|nr:hypothetical protein [Nocardioidaceae bacterium]
MTVIGVLLVLVAALFLIVVLLGGSDETVQFGLGIGSLDLTATAIFLLGAATVLIFVAGLELLRSGLRRSWRRRRELKQARAVVAKHDKHAHQAETGQRTDAGADRDERTAPGAPAPESESGPATGSDSDSRGSTR